MGDLVVGVDAGSSACKTVVVDRTGSIVASARRTYPTVRTSVGVAEQHATDWLGALVESVREVATVVDPARVVAMGVTGPAHNVVLLNRDGRVLAPVIMWSDRRCVQIVERQRRVWGDELLSRAFVDLGSSWSLPQLAWTRDNRPATWAAISTVLPGKDYLVHKLTGSRTTDPTDAAGTALYDPMAGTWMAELLDDVGISRHWLPDIHVCTDLAGGLCASMATRCGLTTGTPVIVGATDTAAELISVGAHRPGDGLVKIATTGTVVAVTSTPTGRAGVLVYPHPHPDRWYALTATNSAGESLRWLLSLFANDPTLGADLDAAAYVDPGAQGLVFLPHIDGNRAMAGLPYGAFVGLDASHSREHLIRSVFEGVSFCLADCWNRLQRFYAMPDVPFLTGGGFRNPLWATLLLGLLARPGRRARFGEPAVGVARLAATGVGLAITPPQAEDVEPPTAQTIHALNVAYQRYRSVERALKAAAQ